MEIEGQSLSAYGKVDEQEEQLYRRKTRKRLLVIVISAVVLIAVTVGAVLGTTLGSNSSNNNNNTPSLKSFESVRGVCNITRYPSSCYSSMSSALKTNPNPNNKTNQNPDDPTALFLLSLQVASDELTKLTSLPQKILSSPEYRNETDYPLVRSSLYDCETLISDALDQVNQSIAVMHVGHGDRSTLLTSKIEDLRTWLSTALTDQDTCLEGLSTTGKHLLLTDEVASAMANSTQYTSNSLAIATNLLTLLQLLQFPINRRLLVARGRELRAGFPWWVAARDRRLLLESNPTPHLTVAKDGSGNFTTIRAALESISRESESRFVIYVKEGVYVENVTLDSHFWNIMIYGDGMNKTIVSNSLNKLDGVSTFSTGTFIAGGKGFIARDMGVRNTAGPAKNQAVALRSSSDQSAFYRCSFEAHQDTLYAHTGRQFYRDCVITGAVDFIFGNAAAIFQNCTIQPRQPMMGQFDTITAQGKFDPNQNTGFSIHNSWLTPLDNLTAPTYLGRPWRNYSTTVVMRSFIGGFLDPTGWIKWGSDEPPNTLFYAEYQNYGPGSAIDKRVAWPGVRPNITQEQAKRFTVESFIRGSQWLAQASIIYNATL